VISKSRPTCFKGQTGSGKCKLILKIEYGSEIWAEAINHPSNAQQGEKLSNENQELRIETQKHESRTNGQIHRKVGAQS